MSASDNPGPISRRIIEALCKPAPDAAVLGGGGRQPAPDAAVLGTGRLYAKLFDRFNSEAQAINGSHLRLKLLPEVVLVRTRRAALLDDIKIKVFVAGEIEETFAKGWWQFAGYLKHDGALLGHTAKYDPARCEKSLQEIALLALRGSHESL
ncbi:MAG TPA: hypothetical protein V6D48_00495 [Oculatellaceae cyanobacterium]